MERTRCPRLAYVFWSAFFIEPCWADGYSLNSISANITLGITFVPPLLSTVGSAYVSNNRPLALGVFKNYAYAREDAAAFVASEGRIHGVQLKRAWRDYLATQPAPELGQYAFATEVLVWNAAE